MMSVNAVLMKFFKLPPALRMMLALAGFGSLATLLFAIVRLVRSGRGLMILLIVAGIGLALLLLFWGIRRLLFRKKSTELSNALDSQGPTRGDVAEQEQIYREKFRSKLVDLKTNGLSVYKLPWFVLVGEPGCGKTASLIHSGLDFPLGKDEVPGFGGTRNYNWWFTNEAVILDTAGRIAFQEEGTTDKVEWEYFLKLLRNHRPRCPVNGVVIALPADRLLRDTSEQRAEKAAILRERLRQVHQTLGVRFPTFVLVTKMDLVGGFSEFFEEIRVDLQQRNQMCGWSRAGEFQEPYDPDTFPAAFDEVHARLRGWGMRYLQRKATEDELGMIVTFPESFGQLREPLADYVTTIFRKSPLIEPPFFRGFYFTSAVQEGAPILDVFSRSKAGVTVAERPTRAVDSKAFFIHDFYADKVFPEHGLVFRSARHVSLNKRMRRVVWIGSAAMFVLLMTVFALGLTGVRGLIKAPYEDCDAAVEAITRDEAGYDDLSASLRLAEKLRGHYDAYGTLWAAVSARLLFVGGDIEVPQARVGQIHARFVLDCLVKPILQEVERRLAGAEMDAMTQESRTRYLDALTVYTKWYGEVVGQHELAALDSAEAAARRIDFERLLELLDLGEADHTNAAEQFELALLTLSAESRSFAREILDDENAPRLDRQTAAETIIAAVSEVTRRWESRTRVSAGNADASIQYWAEFVERVGALRDRYLELLQLRDSFRETGEVYEQACRRFQALALGVDHLGDKEYRHPEAGSLHEAYYNLSTFLVSNPPPETPEHTILRLGHLLERLQGRWEAEFGALRDALRTGAPDETRDPARRVYSALDDAQDSLTGALESSLDAIRDRLGWPGDQELLEYYRKQHLVTIEESSSTTPREKPASITLAPNALGPDAVLRDYLCELRELLGARAGQLDALNDLRRWPGLLEGLRAEVPTGRYLGPWFEAVKQEGWTDRFGEGFERTAAGDVIRQKSVLRDHVFWQPVGLFRLTWGMWQGWRTNSGATLLQQMAEKASATTVAEGMAGLARLMPGFDQPAGLPFERNRFNMEQPAPAPPEAAEEPEEEQEPAEEGLRRLDRRPQRPAEAAEQVEPLRSGASNELLRRYHTRDMLVQTLSACERVRDALQQRAGGEQTRGALGQAADAYIDGYLEDWYRLYSDPTRLLDEQTLALLEKCRDGDLVWTGYVTEISERGPGLADALADRMQSLVRHAVFWDGGPAGDQLPDAAWERFKTRSDSLNAEGHSVPHLALAMRSARNRPERGEPEVVYSAQLSKAWADYSEQVRELGSLTPDAPVSSASVPDLEQLAREVVYRRATTTDFPLITPLVDIARHGQRLLRHHLDSELARRFKAYRGQYPVIEPRAAQDESFELVSLRELAAVDGEDFVSLLRDMARFQRDYGALYEGVQPDSAGDTLRRARAWITFLYEDANELAGAKQPELPRLPLSIEVCDDRSGQYRPPGAFYNTVKVSLPILSQSLDRAPVIERGRDLCPRSVPECVKARPQDEFRWGWRQDVSFQPMTVELRDKNPNAPRDCPDPAVGWTLPANPWSLLMAMGTSPDNELDDGCWKIPVRIQAGNETIGFLIGLRIGSRDRPFPGVIPPPDDPGDPPRMAEASRYLSAPSP